MEAGKIRYGAVRKRWNVGIIIGADIVPIDKNMALFENAKVDELVGSELLGVLKDADYRIFNLEVPLTKELHPISKMGPNLAASAESVAGIKALGADLLTLANNHIMDQGVKGLKSTLQVLKEAGIATVGVGKNLEEASRPYRTEINGKMYGIYACAEHEFSIAGKDTPGANPFDPLESLDRIAALKGQCDYVIVLYHGGKECYRYPSPYLQKVCRKIVEKGADLVVCQHSHCIGCREEYLGGTIVYGQGNFLFPKYDNEFWGSALAISLEQDGSIRFLPIVKEGAAVRLADASAAEKILKEFEDRSEQIQAPGFIEKKYKEFADNTLSDYILYFKGVDEGGRLFRLCNRLSGGKLKKNIISKSKERLGTGMRNFVECEAHRELFLKGLE